jgi:hypothetical protein
MLFVLGVLDHQAQEQLGARLGPMRHGKLPADRGGLRRKTVEQLELSDKYVYVRTAWYVILDKITFIINLLP